MDKIIIWKELRNIFIVGSILLISTIFVIEGDEALAKENLSPAKKLHTSKPTNGKTVNSQLGPEIQVDAYKIRPSKFFVFKRHDRQGVQDFYLWEGTSVNGHGPAKLIVEVAPFHSITGAPTEDKLKTIYKAAIWGFSLSCGLSNFQQTAPSMVSINGFSFARGHWSGKNSQVPWYGFSYVTVVSGKLLGIHGLCQDTPSFKLAEEAAMTFHK